MDWPTVSDEKVIIVGVLVLAAANYVWPGDHPIVNNVISGLFGYMTKATVEMLKAATPPTSSQTDITTKTSETVVSDNKDKPAPSTT